LQALSKLKTTGVLVRRNAANAEEYNLHRLEAEVADLEVEQAKHRHEIAQIYYRRAKEVVHAREFIAPHDGVVIVVLKHKGEPVQPNEPLFRVVDPDRLEVTGQADVTDVWRLQIGQPVRVIPDVAGADLPVEHEEFLGRLVFIDTQIDPLTRTCKVVARIDNRGGLLRSGMEARLEILPVRGNEVPPDAGPERAPRGPLQVPPSRFGNRDRVGTLNLQ
jgi:multidrug efflux pump subunit AcrA (membrane-fusion protein)